MRATERPWRFSSASKSVTERLHGMRARMAGKEPQRTAMNGQPFHVKNIEAVPLEQAASAR